MTNKDDLINERYKLQHELAVIKKSIEELEKQKTIVKDKIKQLEKELSK